MGIQVWGFPDATPFAILKDRVGPPDGLAFSPDSQGILFIGDDGTVRLWDINSNEVKNVIKVKDVRFEVAKFSHDGKTLATISYDNSVRFWDLKQGVARSAIDSKDAVEIAYNPNGSILAVASGNDISLWNTTTLKELAVLKGH